VKIIGKTLEGDLIIQVSQAEWDHLQEKPEATIYEISQGTLEEWQTEFLNGLEKLTLSTRLRNAIENAVEIRKTRYEKVDGKYTEVPADPYLINRYAFEGKSGQLLRFEQWCDFILTHAGYIMGIQMIGKRGKNELLQAIREYKSNTPTAHDFADGLTRGLEKIQGK